MIERLSDDSPAAIKRLFAFPYQLLDMNKIYFDVGAGAGVNARHLQTIPLDADDWDLEKFHKPSERPMYDVDEAVCFQVIEHVRDEELFIENLRILNRKVRIGTINKDVWPFVEGVEVFTGRRNPYHVNEYDLTAFKALARYFADYTFFSQTYDAGQYWMVEGLYANALNFYIHGVLL